MLLPVLALAGLLGLVAGLAVYLFMQQKLPAAGGAEAAEPEAAAAPRVRRANCASLEQTFLTLQLVLHAQEHSCLLLHTACVVYM
jgi:hypothetical protein